MAKPERIAVIACGHSEWNDLIWSWLGRHRAIYGGDSYKWHDGGSWDFIDAVGIMVVCGCQLTVGKYQDGTKDELIYLDSPVSAQALLVKLRKATGLI